MGAEGGGQQAGARSPAEPAAVGAAMQEAARSATDVTGGVAATDPARPGSWSPPRKNATAVSERELAVRPIAAELATRVLSYFSPPLPPETDASFERARSERLRRRIRVYCVVFAVVALLRAFVVLGWGWNASALTGVLEALFAAGVFRWARPSVTLDRLRLAQVTMTLVTVTAAMSLVAARFDGRETLPLGLWPLAWRHLLAAAILPWNWREALFAFGLMWAADVGLVTIDWVRGKTEWLSQVMVLLAGPTLALPGTLLSWWRHSKYRQEYQLTTESEMYRSLSRELESARRVHEAFLPTPIVHPELQLSYVYQPHRQIGGDVLYLHPTKPKPGEPFTLILLDVVGHGIAAALTVNRLLGEIERMFAEAEADDAQAVVLPAALARGLNRYVSLTLAGHGLFATAFIARIDVARDRICWVNCGHPPGFLVSADGQIRRLSSQAMMLGVADEASLGASDLEERFDRGSVLLVCTDGATEARNPAGEPLLTEGVERLLAEQVSAAVPPTEWPARLAAAIAGYRDGPSDDDLLLATVSRVTVPAERLAGLRATVAAAPPAQAGGERTS